MEFSKRIDQEVAAGNVSGVVAEGLKSFYESYSSAIKSCGDRMENYAELHHCFLDLILEQIRSPYPFEPFHPQITQPFNYYQFGLDFIRPLVKLNDSKILGLKAVDKIEKLIAQGQNVILLANHQTEPDPQAISLLLEESHPKLAEEMIFVAGHRVIKDPIAAPFSMGRNLICIFSKKYVENPPEEKNFKTAHNQKTMKKMSQLLAEGGKCIYVAPSGGRDRPNEDGEIEVAPFDPQSLEMFWLMSQHAKTPTHFFPLAMVTYDLLPPPNSIKKELGEHRNFRCTPIGLSFGDEIDMEHFPGSDAADKRLRRKLRADYIWSLVNTDYQTLLNSLKS